MADIWGQKSLLDKKRQEDQPDVYNDLPAENNTRNQMIEAMGLPDTLKQTNQEEEEWRANLPMSMGMGSMGTVGKVGTEAQGLGKVLMQEAPAAKQFGKVIMKPSMQEQMADITSQSPEFFSKIQELLNKQGK